MNYDKPFKTLDEQLNILRARRLEIYDEDKENIFIDRLITMT